ncbi:MAG: sodium:proton antiporter [Chlamydiae bacterium RIFCSPHIGHO2_12_FULL_44_59]|nr:MAG: sodium:proton antiporter [Chlamydiae bacterium RIFCSPHIGHO2_01_FULL_44_39]OGN59983.1 MAG: sodium:proton antiporter [Chlamydiae bacterium RIFCSPHIGHO2_12_FULL_44_59]OGN66198.1 MAG: sodium:proton antiporter [Chlamydiae bacterium RIFCSPLOWO2_01_FULL_44_52]OGN69102.1 MAG: sodium:proton antiporter [Chlamydiae bacterium RIFCSPLOWO2_02_FULL_45_22]OGN69876.1 MAG: sodium:proton antiporter [Chlamydiae bacterium RIFCSPLOWO2_12_FULL_45_20]
MIAIFILGYIAIIFEHTIRVNKTATALLMASLTWMFLFFVSPNVHALGEKVNDISQIIFFLMGAMTLVEVIDAHKGFKVVTDLIQTSSKKKMLWIIGFATFFLSAVLDNLTTTIVMISLLRKLVPDPKERWMLGAMVVIAANAGGAWTPIGDVTTTMLWINGNITTLTVMRMLIVPSLVSLVVALLLLGWNLKGVYPHIVARAHREEVEPGARLIFCAGMGALIFVPIFKALTGLPPFMGILISLGVLWLITDVLHSPHETRQHLRLPHILTRIDTSGVLFFLGILLAISALDVGGILQELAEFLNTAIGNLPIIATLIGLISAVIDNVPLVAAGMGMWDMQTYPADSSLWQMLAFCAGTGGSILIIGSAAGVAFMGLEKVDFIWYLKRVSLIALVSYFAGVAAFILQGMVLSIL